MSFKQFIEEQMKDVPQEQQLSKDEMNAAKLAIERIIKQKYGTDTEPTAKVKRDHEYFGLYKIYVQLANMLRD